MRVERIGFKGVNRRGLGLNVLPGSDVSVQGARFEGLEKCFRLEGDSASRSHASLEDVEFQSCTHAMGILGSVDFRASLTGAREFHLCADCQWYCRRSSDRPS